MQERLEADLASLIRYLLEQGMALDGAVLETISQVLGDHGVDELNKRLAVPDDAEVWSLRDLVLFPDHHLVLAVEGWLLEGERLSRGRVSPDLDALVSALGSPAVRLRLRLPDSAAMELILDQEETRRLLARLHLNKTLPEPVGKLLGASVHHHDRQRILELRLACRHARLTWTPEQISFVLQLLRGCIGDLNRDSGPRKDLLQRRFLDVLRWALGFLEHAGEDIPKALAHRWESLQRSMDQAEELERVREKHNFETRRMLGIAEQHLDLEAIRDELALIEIAATATGCTVPMRLHQVVQHDLGDVHTLEQAGRLLQ